MRVRSPLCGIQQRPAAILNLACVLREATSAATLHPVRTHKWLQNQVTGTCMTDRLSSAEAAKGRAESLEC